MTRSSPIVPTFDLVSSPIVITEQGIFVPPLVRTICRYDSQRCQHRVVLLSEAKRPSIMCDFPVMADLLGTIQRMSRAHAHTTQVTYYFGDASTWVSVVSTRISKRTDATNLLATILSRRLVEPADQIGKTSYSMSGYLIPK
jgi:hypothetical protein